MRRLGPCTNGGTPQRSAGRRSIPVARDLSQLFFGKMPRDLKMSDDTQTYDWFKERRRDYTGIKRTAQALYGEFVIPIVVPCLGDSNGDSGGGDGVVIPISQQ